LRRRGVVHAAVFGSVARGDDTAESDVDILVDLDPAIISDFLAYAAIAAELEETLGREVDVAQRSRLRSHVRLSAEATAVYAF
jgi:predicted nucleotidyltransferase